MHIISAAMAQALPDGLATEIVYLPEGTHKIHPTVNGRPKEITVHIAPEKGEQIAASFQRDFAERSKGNVRPWFDFEHKGGVASANPTGFRYEPGKGIMAAVNWTGAGKSAVEGRDFSYFSPTFLMDDDGVPAGLPDRGPLGALVNEPAFREIPRIAAQDAAEPHPKSEMKLICAALAITPGTADAEEQAVAAIKTLKDDKATVEASLSTAKTENTNLKTENHNLKVKVEAGYKDKATTLVEAAIADGRLAPKNDEMNNSFITAITEELGTDKKIQQTILAGLPKQHKGIDKPIVKASDKPAEKDEKDLTPYERIEAAFAAESATDDA